MDSDRPAATHRDHPLIGATATGSDPGMVDEIAYPISPDYVKSWTPVRALCELIANALDEDPAARVGWAHGVLTITDTGPGIPEEGLILGYSTKTDAQIGQFGEGKKLACLVLARSENIGAVRCETVGYGFIPTVARRRLLAGLIPSRSEQGAEVLVYHLFRTDRALGTTITVECDEQLAREAIGRFRALTEPGYTPPAPPGTCVRDGAPGRVWIGGVLVSEVRGLLASYDLPLADKALQNRDRTVIEAGALRDAVRAVLADSADPEVIDLFARHVLAGGRLREPEQFFGEVLGPRVRAGWRTWARGHLPERTFYTTSGQERDTLDLREDQGYTEVSAPGLPEHQMWPFMALLGVEVARIRQRQQVDRARRTTVWVADRDLTPAQRTALADAVTLIRRAIGGFALDRVRVYAHSEERACTLGFYDSGSGTVAVRLDALAERRRLLMVLMHEAAHRVAHRGGGIFLPVRDFQDRERGFEQVLSDFAALLLEYLADARPLPALDDTPAPPPVPRRRVGMHDPAVPLVRRQLARLVTDRLPHALAAGGFADIRALVHSTAVHRDYWRVLENPKPLGYRRAWGGTAWHYDKLALLAEALGVHPPVVWLGYNLCEAPFHGRHRDNWDKPGAWSATARQLTQRACTDLEALGGVYAEQVPALRALLDGTTPTPKDDEGWQAPVLALIAAERQRLGLPQPT